VAQAELWPVYHLEVAPIVVAFRRLAVDISGNFGDIHMAIQAK
jgi:hypothetical protein